MWALVLAQQRQSMHADSNASLHIEDAGSPDASIGHTKRHLLQRAYVPDGVYMPEQQDRPAIGDSGKVRLHVVAKRLSEMDLRVRSVMFESRREKVRKMIDGAFVTARGFDFNQRLEVRDQQLLACASMGKRNHGCL